MLLKKIMANPILMIGILFLIIFIYQIKNKGIFKDRIENLQANSCRSALIMLDKRIPKTWTTSCNENNMSVKIASNLRRESYKDDTNYKASMYRELANSLVFISKNSANDSLERVPWVVVLFESDKMGISARTQGSHLARFATLNNSQMIAEHLKASVEVKEAFK